MNDETRDLNLCMDDLFPGCDGTRTHPLRVSQIMAIPEIKKQIKQSNQELLDQIIEWVETKKEGLNNIDPYRAAHDLALEKVISKLQSLKENSHV